VKPRGTCRAYFASPAIKDTRHCCSATLHVASTIAVGMAIGIAIANANAKPALIVAKISHQKPLSRSAYASICSM